MDDNLDGRPFQTRIAPPAYDGLSAAEDVPPIDTEDSDWSLDALEEAYQRALNAAEAATDQVEVATVDADHGSTSPAQEAESPNPVACLSENGVAAARIEDESAFGTVSTEKVLEALLFVGGDPLTGRRLAELLGGEHLHAELDGLISQLDERYAEQGRPYYVQLAEGGYRLSLRPEFETIRNRVYGLGPKDVRLSQDSLEILALVAYRQPIAKPTLEETGKPNVAAILRQLLRLELVALERGDGGKDDVSYHTTQRFLDLFSLDRLEDLPHPEDLMFR